MRLALALVLLSCAPAVRTPAGAGTATAPVTGPESGSQSNAESGSAAVTESDADSATVAESDSATVAESDSATESGSATVTESESGAAQPVEADPVAALLALPESHSTSLGSVGFGTLQGGVALPKTGPGFMHNPRRPHEARFGTVEMVQAIVRAAAAVEREMPGSGLVVNDICLEQGGPLRQHGSHQNGRDADILFYALDADGEPRKAVGVPIEPDLSGWDFKDLSVKDDDEQLWLDAPRTWRFVQGLLEAAGDHVQRIFIVEHVRSALLEAAAEMDAPAAIVERFAMVSCQPGSPHDDHMHVRFHCSPQDIAAGCVDKAPVYPWRREQLAALGVEPVMETWKMRQQGKKARAGLTTSRQQARAKAERKYGKLHRDVRRFLERREGWAQKPSPGRPYCR